MLETIWFFLWMLLWAVYFILDGFDLGIGVLHPFVSQTEEDKRILYACAGPFWDGNEVWLIAAGGVTFAAFPKAYAVMFSALYAPLLMLLFGLILRAVSFEFRDKVESGLWCAFWDVIHFIANLIPALLLGVAFANLFMGIPVDAQGVYHGSLMGLLNPYGIAGGIFFIAIFALHGALWLLIKTEGKLQLRALTAANCLWTIVFLILLVFLVMTLKYTNVFDNYLEHPLLTVFPILAVVSLFGIRAFLRAGKMWKAWGASALFILAVTFFGVCGMYPGLIISSLDANATVTIYTGASTELTLKIMLGVAVIMVPIVIAYQFWMYRLFSAPVTGRDVLDHYEPEA